MTKNYKKCSQNFLNGFISFQSTRKKSYITSFAKPMTFHCLYFARSSIYFPQVAFRYGIKIRSSQISMILSNIDFSSNYSSILLSILIGHGLNGLHFQPSDLLPSATSVFTRFFPVFAGY